MFFMMAITDGRKDLKFSQMIICDVCGKYGRYQVFMTYTVLSPVSYTHLDVYKRQAFIINTSRGALIDEAALIEALKNGTIAGAGLDVQETEPPEENSPLYTMDNVLLTPHMGWKGLETRQRLVSILADNIKKFTEGNPINVVSGLSYLAK